MPFDLEGCPASGPDAKILQKSHERLRSVLQIYLRANVGVCWLGVVRSSISLSHRITVKIDSSES